MLVHCKPHLSPVYTLTHGKRYVRRGDVAEAIRPVVRRGRELRETDGTVLAVGPSEEFTRMAVRLVLSGRSK